MNSLFSSSTTIILLGMVVFAIVAFYLFKSRRTDSYKIVIAVITVLTMLTAIIYQISNNREGLFSSRYTAANDELRNEFRNGLRAVQEQIDNLQGHSPEGSDSVAPAFSNSTEIWNYLERKLSKMQEEISEQKEITTSLRQAINPIKPDEILTIVRLKDEVNALTKSVATIDDNLKTRQQNFEDSIKREISSLK